MSKRKTKPTGYAVYYHARYQDCHEEGGTVVPTKAQAFAYMERLSRDPSCMIDFNLFELGPEVPFKAVKVVEESVTKHEKVKYEDAP